MKVKLLLLLLFLAFKLSAQEKLKGIFDYRVTYKLSFQLDSTDNDSQKSEYMFLFVGDDYSNYISRSKTLNPQIVREGNTAHSSKEALTNFQYQILKKRNKGELLYLYKIPGMNDRFYYDQSMDLFDWKIHTETKKIKKYLVQKATTSFAGRNYTAWFSPELPIPDGPYKFNGLPGLILEIGDDKGFWNFEFFGLEKLSSKERFKISMNLYQKMSKSELTNLVYEYRRDPMGYANNPNVHITPEFHKKYIESFTEMLKSENNPIELE